MKIKINNNLENFKSIINLFSNIYSEGNFKFEKDTATLKVFSGNTGAVVEFENTFFDEIDGEQEVTIKLLEFNKLIKSCKKDLEIEITDIMKFKSGKTTYTLPLYTVDPTQDFSKLFKLEYDFIEEIPLSILSDGLKTTEMLKEEEIELYTADGKLHIKGEEGVRKVDTELIDTGKVVECKLSKTYVKAITLASVDNIIMKLKKNTPAIFSYTIPNAAVKYFIAPRI